MLPVLMHVLVITNSECSEIWNIAVRSPVETKVALWALDRPFCPGAKG